MVSHTIECCAFVVQGSKGSIAYSGDTGRPSGCGGPHQTPDLRAMLMEVSFPNREQRLATNSGHHTPKTLGPELRKYERSKELPVILYHIKPVFRPR